MTNKSKIFIIVALFAVIGIGYSVSTGSAPNEATLAVAPASEESDDTANINSNPAKGAYLAYDSTAVADSAAEHIVLNFHATWCPSCRALDTDINENLAAIPGGVEIYKVDYDSNVDLRQQYGVTTQHTLVVIAADGTMIDTWRGGNTLDSIITKL